MQFFIFDVESIGIHGEGFAVAGGIYELGQGRVLSSRDEFCFSCPTGKAQGNIQNRVWVNDNVPPIEVTHKNPQEVRDAFWHEWRRASNDGIPMAVECGWPVEARFLNMAVSEFMPNREWEGPYPLHEIASFMLAAGMDPLATWERDPDELPAHHPTGDVRLSARILSQALAQISA